MSVPLGRSQYHASAHLRIAAAVDRLTFSEVFNCHAWCPVSDARLRVRAKPHTAARSGVRANRRDPPARTVPAISTSPTMKRDTATIRQGGQWGID